MAIEAERAGSSNQELGLGVVAAAAAVAKDDLVIIASDDGQADDLGRLIAAFDPAACVSVLPAPDLPAGETGTAAPAISARRFAALRALATTSQRRVLVASIEAATRDLPAHADIAAAVTLIEVGMHAASDVIARELIDAGYHADEPVDEPGEFAVRGAVLDLFPAADDRPVRIEFDGETISAMRRFDPLTQLGIEGAVDNDVAIIPIGGAAPGETSQLIEHMSGACLLWACDPGPDQVAAAGALAKTFEVTKAPAAGRIARPVEARNPTRAFLKLVRDRRTAGDRVVLLGSARDLRFLSARLTRALKEAPVAVASWHEVVAAGSGTLVSLEAPADGSWTQQDITGIAAVDLLGSRADRGGEVSADPFATHGAVRRGDVVVHEQFGVAIVQGLEDIEANGATTDVLRLEHAKGAVRLIPVETLDRVWRYGAEADAVTLDRLDGSGWAERRAEIDAAIGEAARALVALAKRREMIDAPKLEPTPADYERFARGFGHALTTGQAQAVAAIEADLRSGRPMDRLLVGDVGYGKTEVALRAAAQAALAGRQVVIAAPTTVLVRQHLESFSRRFKDFGIGVESLSRLSTPAEVKRVKAALADGSLRVVVGTQAVASAAFADLALVIIDEEQRFGAAVKTRLRELAGDGHVLTLTATPIPRTLQAALVGLQQLSLITTPPARRQPIRTIVTPFDDGSVGAALRRERERGGQSFVVTPRIEDLENLAARLAQATPELRVVQAHGKLPAADLDAVMVGFADGEGDVLLATNIIEAGLDVPRANTMIVWHADRFGLSQLHQLRGRVGRGGRRGQVLLTTDADAEIAPATLKRLSTLEAFDRLGAGFAISAQDLDLRGAGDLVGEEQAGHMKLVGVDLYQHLFALAIRTARGEPVDDWQPELHLGIGAILPAGWLNDEDLRIELYTRLARLPDADALEEFREELEDRFGALPVEVETLLKVARLRLLARAAQVERLDAGPAALALTPRGTPDWAREPGPLAERNGRWLLQERHEEPADQLDRAADLLSDLVAA